MVDSDRREPGSPLALVLQPYVPEYRVEFFDTVDRRLAAEGLELRVVSGRPSQSQAARRDEGGTRPWHVTVPQRRGLPGGMVSRTVPHEFLSRARVVVAELATSNLDMWRLVLRRQMNPDWQLLLWGHVKNFVNDESALGVQSKKIATRMADGVLAYTEEGAITARSWTRGKSIVTTLNNSRAVSPMTSSTSDLRSTRLVFVGGLDPSKRLEDLLAVGRDLAHRIPGFELVVIGDGPDRHLIEGSRSHAPWMRFVGRKSGDEKWELLASSAGILMPGRVGLVVIDSFAAELPVVTQRWRYHAPEFAYLEHEKNALIGNDVADMVEQAYRLMTDANLRNTLAAGCRVSHARYSVHHMVDNFVQAVVRAASRP